MACEEGGVKVGGWRVRRVVLGGWRVRRVVLGGWVACEEGGVRRVGGV